eukprot:359198-Chlamydomonas_euryale.AAC.1
MTAIISSSRPSLRTGNFRRAAVTPPPLKNAPVILTSIRAFRLSQFPARHWRVSMVCVNAAFDRMCELAVTLPSSPPPSTSNSSASPRASSRAQSSPPILPCQRAVETQP